MTGLGGRVHIRVPVRVSVRRALLHAAFRFDGIRVDVGAPAGEIGGEDHFAGIDFFFAGT